MKAFSFLIMIRKYSVENADIEILWLRAYYSVRKMFMETVR